jgi:uncharacterized membrane protein
MTFSSLALAVHIAAVVVAFGPLFAYPLLTASVRRADPTALPALYRAQHLVAQRIVPPALPSTLIAGLYLAAEEDAFGKAWVVAPMVVIVVLMALHRFVLIRGYQRLAQRTGQPEAAGGRDLASRVNRAQLLAAALVVFTIWVMAVKPSA